jgi:hypothetical protein
MPREAAGQNNFQSRVHGFRACPGGHPGTTMFWVGDFAAQFLDKSGRTE